MRKLEFLLLTLVFCLVSTKARSATCEGLFKSAIPMVDPLKKAKVFDEITLATEWSQRVFEGKDTQHIEEQIAGASKRMIPFGRTFVREDGTSTRRVSQIFRIVYSGERMIFLQAKKGSIQLLIGAPVSKATMDAAARNSLFLIAQPPNPEPKFSALFGFIVSASNAMKDVHNIDAYAHGQDPANREVAPVGNVALVPIDLNKSLTPQQLADFLLVLWMAAEGS